MDTVDQPNSICHIQSIHMYPLHPGKFQNSPPFGLLSGEMVLYFDNCVDGPILLTNYRLYLQSGENQYHIPLGLIESIEIRELFYLQLFCKDARTYRCTFENNETALEWYGRITKSSEPPRQIEQLFAFYFYIWAKEKGGSEFTMRNDYQKRYIFDKNMFEAEMARMQFQGDSWRITKANENYKLCPTYPPYLLVPSCINDEMLEHVAKFRSSRRIPSAVWRHPRNGAIIARCSQPEVGWLGWRSSEDEELLKAISDACNFDKNLRTNSSSDRDSVFSHSPGSLNSDESLHITGEVTHQEEKLLIMDARSYTTAVANRARGGGCECPEYYPNCEIQFMNLANIHSIRKSFHAIRQLCMASADQPNWFSLLEGTRWMLHMSGLIKAAVTLATAIERDGRPVLVHCSDGWDRTPQIVALGELLLDPYYRTVEGFRVLIEREWLGFGHKFADRCGHSGGSDDLNERCPVFLQWLDCVHQLLNQYPISFEFSQNFLIKLAQHTYSNLFGTFLCNSLKQRKKVVLGKTFSIWDFLNSASFKNHLYAPESKLLSGRRVLWPKTNVRDLRFWSEVYLGSIESSVNPEQGSKNTCLGTTDSNEHSNMVKTRSYGDLMSMETCHIHYGNRRSSDPSVNREMKLLTQDTSSNTIMRDNNIENGRASSQPEHYSASDLLSSELEDNPINCNKDCIFNKDAQIIPNLTDDQIDGLEFEPYHVKSETVPQKAVENALHNSIDNSIRPTNLNNLCDTKNKSESIFLQSKPYDMEATTNMTACLDSVQKGGNDLDEELFLENENHSESGRSELSDEENNRGNLKLEEGLKNVDLNVESVLKMEKSIETSTDTLVSEQLTYGISQNGSINNEVNKSPKTKTINGTDSCKKCAQNSIKKTYGYLSQTPSRWDHDNFQGYFHTQLGEDGLIPVRSPIQERLDQIFEEHKRKVELLEKELHTSRQILIKQACHKCHPSDCERQDDTSSVIESVISTSEGQASAGESLRSDLSWVAVEDGIASECQGTLWVPDHAVSKCTGCGTEFWLGRRRHHCRKCGKIFCADCSEYTTPLPSEQLFDPVRVCSGCYSELTLTKTPETVNSTVEPSGRCERRSLRIKGDQKFQTRITASSN